MKNKVIVVSGINLFEGGPLSVYKDFLDALVSAGVAADNWIILYVHKKELFADYEQHARIVELPESRKNYLRRLYYEYIYFAGISRKHKIDYWISLHDITPGVRAGHLYTYCHQPAPFYRPDRTDWKYSRKVCAFALLYRYLYGINIRKNDAVVVQQNWIKKEFMRIYGIENVITARPERGLSMAEADSGNVAAAENRPYIFIYASYPRSFKNFEVVCEACRRLGSRPDYQVYLTLKGDENPYSRYLYRKFADLKQIKWLGILPREELFRRYRESDCMIFPSKLETWGLPVSEYRMTGKPVILADLPYAHETIGEYGKACFFNCRDAEQLARIMRRVMKGTYVFSRHPAPEKPDAENWTELCHLIFKEE